MKLTFMEGVPVGSINCQKTEKQGSSLQMNIYKNTKPEDLANLQTRIRC